MDWQGFLYMILGITISLFSIIIYIKIAEPISSYIVEGNIKIKEEDYYDLEVANEELIEDIEKLEKAKKLRRGE